MKYSYKQILTFFYVFIVCAFGHAVYAQNMIKGKVVDELSQQPLEGASIFLLPGKFSGITDQLGFFNIKNNNENTTGISISSIGYASKIISLTELKTLGNSVSLVLNKVALNEVIIASVAGDQYKSIGKIDIALRGVNNSQELLRIIPGVIISQHQGGGKAEQILLRGFDADHGTDFRMDVDGLPINMVSHAHGQGFADSHFIIPETLDGIDFKKGPYAASRGDFATTGYVDFNTRNFLRNNLIKIEGGRFNSFRGLAMLNLLGKNAKAKQQSWYMASEYRYSDAFFDHPQHFKRLNFFTKYNGKISRNSTLSISATSFRSKWNASGQIPGRAVEKGIISFYGAIDPFEGGITSRTNLNAQVLTSLPGGDILKNQVFYSNSHFDLHTNFTFFLVDTINGDQIRQKEARNLFGYNLSYQHSSFLGNIRISTEAGFQLRTDLTRNSELSQTKNRYTLLNRIKLGNISEISVSPYLSKTFKFNEHFSVNTAVRFDQFFYRYKNKLESDSTLPGIGIFESRASAISPKLNLYYNVNDRVQFYFSNGKGFHSNDARASVIKNGSSPLPAVYSSDLGTVIRPAKNIILSAAIWYITLAQETVYSGDGGDVRFNAETKRRGFDFSARYEPFRSVFIDADINYAHGRSGANAKSANFIPLAPVWTSSAGISYSAKKGINGSIRYRYLGDRPGNEDYSLTAKGYFITDAVLNYTKAKYEIGLVINNIFNTRWKETQFATESRLKGEDSPVDEIHFTAGTKFSATLSFSIKF